MLFGDEIQNRPMPDADPIQGVDVTGASGLPGGLQLPQEPPPANLPSAPSQIAQGVRGPVSQSRSIMERMQALQEKQLAMQEAQMAEQEAARNNTGTNWSRLGQILGGTMQDVGAALGHRPGGNVAKFLEGERAEKQQQLKGHQEAVTT